MGTAIRIRCSSIHSHTHRVLSNPMPNAGHGNYNLLKWVSAAGRCVCVCVCVELRNKRKERRLLTLNLGKLSCGAKWELKSKKKIKIPISKQAALIMYTSIYLSKWTNCWT